MIFEDLRNYAVFGTAAAVLMAGAFLSWLCSAGVFNVFIVFIVFNLFIVFIWTLTKSVDDAAQHESQFSMFSLGQWKRWWKRWFISWWVLNSGSLMKRVLLMVNKMAMMLMILCAPFSHFDDDDEDESFWGSETSCFCCFSHRHWSAFAQTVAVGLVQLFKWWWWCWCWWWWWWWWWFHPGIYLGLMLCLCF